MSFMSADPAASVDSMLYPLTEGIDEDEWLRAAARNPALRDLEAPEGDVYSLEDGDPFLDQA
jgi:hypothetical protein